MLRESRSIDPFNSIDCILSRTRQAAERLLCALHRTTALRDTGM